jgi:hypothetical protein
MARARTVIRAPQCGQAMASEERRDQGSESTHCRTGTAGSTPSTQWAARSAMRRPAHGGQKPAARPQANGTSR